MSNPLSLQATRGIVVREFLRTLRQRGRLISALGRPLFWLFIVGPGLARLVPADSGISYQQYLFPGVLGIVILFASILSALSAVYDREFGTARLMLIAPISRANIVVSKVIAGALLSVAQALVILVLAPFIGIRIDPLSLLTLPFVLFLASFSLAALGMFMASRIDSLENFSTVINFVIFPMFFLSGGLYPVKQLPAALRGIVYFNPITYGIDLLQHLMLPTGMMSAANPVWLDLLALVAFALLFLTLAILFFDRETKLIRLAR